MKQCPKCKQIYSDEMQQCRECQTPLVNYVYYTLNGTGDWTYIGNLAGSVDTSKWAQIDSPHFVGIPTAPTPEDDNNSQQIATTQFVKNAVKNIGVTSIKNFKCSEIQPNPATHNHLPNVALGEWFLFTNDRQEDDFDTFMWADDYYTKLSEPIPPDRPDYAS